MNKQEIEAKAHEYATIAFGNPKTMFPSQIIQYNNGHEGFVRGALWMQQNQSGMRWVRASDKPTELLRSYYCITYSEHFKQEFRSEVLITLDGTWQHHNKVLFWLDESASSEVERLRKERDAMLVCLENLVRDCYKLDMWAKEEMTEDQYWEEYKGKNNL